MKFAKISPAVLILLWMSFVFSADAFSLRGPLAPWMDIQKGYHARLAGPMDREEEYRWNVPVVTYGFDEKFLEAFGQPGVEAVTAAFDILNALPKASEINLDEYPTESSRWNFLGQESNVLDMKSMCLSLLLGEMGLYNPENSTFLIRQKQSGFTNTMVNEGTINTNLVVLQRNFDPDSLTPSPYVNFTRYTYGSGNYSPDLDAYWLNIMPTDPFASIFTAVAGNGLYAGEYITGLTRDDVGGLRYLMRSNNLNIEPLLPNVSGTGSNETDFVSTALRPGIEKITFSRLSFDSATKQFVAVTNIYTESYMTNGGFQQQTLQRVVSHPDILFTARDFNGMWRRWRGVEFLDLPMFLLEVADTSHWTNCSLLSGSFADGPGIIKPGAVIAFQDLYPYVLASGNQTVIETNMPVYRWGSFGGGTNIVILHGDRTNQIDYLTLAQRVTTNGFEWGVLANLGAAYEVETSSTLTNWQLWTTLTNSTGILRIADTNISPQQKFYRIRKKD